MRCLTVYVTIIGCAVWISEGRAQPNCQIFETASSTSSDEAKDLLSKFPGGAVKVCARQSRHRDEKAYYVQSPVAVTEGVCQYRSYSVYHYPTLDGVWKWTREPSPDETIVPIDVRYMTLLQQKCPGHGHSDYVEVNTLSVEEFRNLVHA
jgi:hypothetical protein